MRDTERTKRRNRIRKYLHRKNEFSQDLRELNQEIEELKKDIENINFKSALKSKILNYEPRTNQINDEVEIAYTNVIDEIKRYVKNMEILMKRKDRIIKIRKIIKETEKELTELEYEFVKEKYYRKEQGKKHDCKYLAKYFRIEKKSVNITDNRIITKFERNWRI